MRKGVEKAGITYVEDIEAKHYRTEGIKESWIQFLGGSICIYVINSFLEAVQSLHYAFPKSQSRWILS